MRLFSRFIQDRSASAERRELTDAENERAPLSDRELDQVYGGLYQRFTNLERFGVDVDLPIDRDR